MMDSSLIDRGLDLMLFGMGTVFVFLTVLVFATSAMSAVITRWFPEKVINIWNDLHEFERMGLVMEYFQKSKLFKDLETYSIRGLPRPTDDKYFPELMDSDPIYAVWGYRT